MHWLEVSFSPSSQSTCSISLSLYQPLLTCPHLTQFNLTHSGCGARRHGSHDHFSHSDSSRSHGRHAIRHSLDAHTHDRPLVGNPPTHPPTHPPSSLYRSWLTMGVGRISPFLLSSSTSRTQMRSRTSFGKRAWCRYVLFLHPPTHPPTLSSSTNRTRTLSRTSSVRKASCRYVFFLLLLLLLLLLLTHPSIYL